MKVATEPFSSARAIGLSIVPPPCPPGPEVKPRAGAGAIPSVAPPASSVPPPPSG
jgi:hypothetical protein